MTIRKYSISKAPEFKDLPQIAAIVISCIPSFITGLIIAWPSPSVKKILEDTDTYNITSKQASHFSVLNAIGPVTLSVFVARLSDGIGRKRTLMISAVPHSICWLMKALCTDLKLLYVARVIGGIGDSFMYNSLPMYIGEVSTPRVRGVWGNSLICALYLGLFSINLIGSFCTVQISAFICLSFPILFIILFSFMPESPYYYAMCNKDEETIKSLQRLRGTDNVTEEFKRLKVDVHRQMSEQRSWIDLIRIESNKRALIAGVFLRVSQNFSGLLAFPVYAQYMFERAGTSINPKISAILYTGLSALSYIIAANFADRLGRRKSYILSMCLTSIPLFVDGVYFCIKEEFPEIDMTLFDFLPLVVMIIFIAFVSLGVGLVPTLMLGELFSTSVKVKSISIVTTFFSLSYFIANNIFYYSNDLIGLYAPFFIYGCSNIFSAVLANHIIPETKGKTLEEIQQQLKFESNKLIDVKV